MSSRTPKLLTLLIFIILLLPWQRAASRGMATAHAAQTAYLPLVAKNYPPVVLTDWWVGNAEGYRRSAFLPGEGVRYITVGDNFADAPITVTLRWEQSGPCGATQIFSGTLPVDPGLWVHSVPASAPDCLGTYTNTVQLASETPVTFSQTQISNFEIVTYTSEITVSDKHGFDKCALPSVAQMQTWWQHSPYWVFNIYLGGSSLACDNPQLNANWVWQVSQQGWEFILTWVGPQSHCFHPASGSEISQQPAIARQQGRDEADLAIAAAEALNLRGDKIIYYDLEGYTDNGACRAPADAFITGWTERLHERGFKAGAYGSPCRSYVSDWWDNTPVLDDIWIAWWSYDAYDPSASVWREGCGLTNAMWPGARRLRQYAGGHVETWGGENLSGSIDSNVLLGEVTAITVTAQVAAPAASPRTLPVGATPPLRDAALLPGGDGWALQGNRLLWRRGETGTWEDITPSGAFAILDVDFPDPRHGFLVSAAPEGAYTLYQTADSGATWRGSPLPLPAVDVGAVYLDFVNARTGWIALKMVSGSAFSIGRLFATTDGGATWEARPLPLGEAVQFSDALHGWVRGGPTGNAVYRTDDGGCSWVAATAQAHQSALPQPRPVHLPENTAALSWGDEKTAWALTRNGTCAGYLPLEAAPPPDGRAPLPCLMETRLWLSPDRGQTWLEITP